MLKKIRDFIWPVLNGISDHERKEVEYEETVDLSEIETTNWSADVDTALHESHRIAEEEEGRIRNVESKASTLLLFVGALIPFLTYLEAAAFGEKQGSASYWIEPLILALAILYLGKASLWAFKTLSVGNFHRVYSRDLVKVWKSEGQSKTKLISEVLSATRRNQNAVNSKVDALKMTHAFLLRAILALSALVFIRVLFAIWNNFGHKVIQLIQSWVC